MRYGFINNFSQVLAADLAAGATTMTLDGGGALLSAASADLVYTLTLDDGEGTTEIVHVTGQTTNDLTIVRAQEGTTAQGWTAGTTVEMRVTAGILGGAVLTTTDSNTIGQGASVTGATNAISIGPSASVTANFGVALGDNATASGEYGFALGPYATASGEDSVAVGYGTASSLHAISVGEGSSATGVKAIALGSSAQATAEDAMAVGRFARAAGVDSTAYGNSSYAGEPGALAIGAYARVLVPGGMVTTGVPYAKKSALSGASLDPSVPEVALRTSRQVIITTEQFDLRTLGEVEEIALPTDAFLFIDSLDVVITFSSAPSGSPEIQVGTDAGTPADLLASTIVTGAAVGDRQSASPLLTSGVSKARVEVTAAGAGTSYFAKLVVRGYVMEL